MLLIYLFKFYLTNLRFKDHFYTRLFVYVHYGVLSSRVYFWFSVSVFISVFYFYIFQKYTPLHHHHICHKGAIQIEIFEIVPQWLPVTGSPLPPSIVPSRHFFNTNGRGRPTHHSNITTHTNLAPLHYSATRYWPQYNFVEPFRAPQQWILVPRLKNNRAVR